MSDICLDVVVRDETGTGQARAARREGMVPGVLYGGEEKSDVQFHPVSDMPVHVDFFRVTAKSIIEVEVPVIFTGDDVAPGIKRGGILNVVRYAIEVKCPAGDIPDNITVDISEMDIGDSLHISDVNLPENVKPSIDDRDFTIATIVSSRASKEDEEDAEGDEAETEEGAEGEAPAADAGDE